MAKACFLCSAFCGAVDKCIQAQMNTTLEYSPVVFPEKTGATKPVECPLGKRILLISKLDKQTISTLLSGIIHNITDIFPQ